MLKLVSLCEDYKKHLTDMMDEWCASGEKVVPYSIRRLDYRNFKEYLNGFEGDLIGQDITVPSSTFFCLDTDRDIFVGAVNIRHYLNESLLLNGGHIGDGIRLSERRKGYATKMVALAIKECKMLGINKILMVCDRENIGSAKSIVKNNGVLENEIEINGIVEQRYWITV